MSLVDSIKERVELTDALHLFNIDPPNGKKLIRCPFHDEKTASFQVKGERWRCYGCGLHGDLIDLAAHALGIDNKAAIHFWAERLHLVDERPTPEREKELEDRRRLRGLKDTAHRLSLELEQDLPRPTGDLSMHDYIFTAKDEIDARHKQDDNISTTSDYIYELWTWHGFASRVLARPTSSEDPKEAFPHES